MGFRVEGNGLLRRRARPSATPPAELGTNKQGSALRV